MNVVYFLNKFCKTNQHTFCHGSWTGFGFQCNCECKCHQEKNNAKDEVGQLASLAIGTSASEESQRR
jgi:hypothetical protein